MPDFSTNMGGTNQTQYGTPISLKVPSADTYDFTQETEKVTRRAKTILSSPDYETASPDLKQAIFDKNIASSPLYYMESPEVKRAIRQKFGIPDAPEIPDEGGPVSRAYQAARPYIAPVVEGIGAVGGGIVGGIGGLAAGGVGAVPGAVLGSGLGYGMAKGGVNVADALARGENVFEGRPTLGGLATGGVNAATDVATGMAMELGGQYLGKGLAWGAGKILDIGKGSALKAGKILREAATNRGPGQLPYDVSGVTNALGSIDEAKALLRAYAENPSNIPAEDVANALKVLGQNEGANSAQLVAGLNRPTLQAAFQSGSRFTPEVAAANAARQEATTAQSLQGIAGSSTPTEAISLANSSKAQLNAELVPKLEAAFAKGNLGSTITDLEALSGQLDQSANAAVAEARKFYQLGNTAAANGRLRLIREAMPVSGLPYTYEGELAGMADNWVGRAADQSLDLGWGSREAGNLAAGLRGAGIKPINAKSVADNIRGLADPAADPELAGVPLVRNFLNSMAHEIELAAQPNGTIRLEALDSIRKNAVNDFLAGIPGDPSAKQAVEERVMMRLKPYIKNLVETSGGTGYNEAIDTYAQGMGEINKKNLIAKAYDLWRNPGTRNQFVDLIRGAKPEDVEAILGSGKFDIAKELPPEVMGKLQDAVRLHLRDMEVSSQASQGQEALRRLLVDNITKWRAPSMLSKAITLGNEGLKYLENKLGRNIMNQLAMASNDPAYAKNLIETLPAVDRIKVLSILNNPKVWAEMPMATQVGTRIPGSYVSNNVNSILEDL